MQVRGFEFTIGADPELFVKKDNCLVSAHGLVPGTKRIPHNVKDGAVQVDGMALEFNIKPCLEEQEFISTLESVLSTLMDMIPGHELVYDPSVLFDEETINSSPFEALELGCEPDYNAYTQSINPPPENPGRLRTAGGHVHIGGLKCDNHMSQEHFAVCNRLSKLLDEEIGVYSILWDNDDKRRELYGKAGSYRPKFYGMEYRTLSNKWIFNKAIVSFVYQGVRRALEKMFDPTYIPDEDIPFIIDFSHRENDFFKNNELADYVRDVCKV